ncbi:hypothetical protein O1W68_02810 [Rhodococcus sp. H36-A4]|uniref:hypothetical protein n=1 Tax=Rhodococcus sp. H36-A4 TaxID=3004353 RepID=UPI0022B03C23|nr:hypothetical protein [Rhodococcus sp. H36-A4]MCZ4076862.1 hypothetical protein [Rhodococcus sp. H36-A4]
MSATAREVRGGQIRATDRLTLVLVDDHHVDNGVIDLNLIENPRHQRWNIAGGLTWASGIRSTTRSSHRPPLPRRRQHTGLHDVELVWVHRKQSVADKNDDTVSHGLILSHVVFSASVRI